MILTSRFALSTVLVSLLSALLSSCGQAPSAAVQVNAFSASPPSAPVGTPIVLTWATSGATACTLVTTETVPLEPERCAAGSSEVTFETPGTYSAYLEASSREGTQASRSVTFEVTETGTLEPSFESTSDGLNVAFTAAAQAEGSQYLWDFGDDARAEGQQVTHLYDAPGTYRVTLTVMGPAGEGEVAQDVEVGDAVSRERVTLFGSDLGAWQRKDGSTANWRLGNDGSPYFEVVPGRGVGANDLETRDDFGDFRLHLEFWVPQTPESNTEQSRGNSGVYLQGRYEVQILDSYDHPLTGENDAGAIYEVKDADSNASRPAQTWQSYDIVFRAARYSGGQKTENARVSVTWNGQLVHDNVPIPAPTRLGDNEVGESGALAGPLRLQDHGYGVRYRNIWLEPL